MMSDTEVCMKQMCGAESFHGEKTASVDIHQHLLNVYEDQTLDVSIERHFSSGNSDVTDKSCSN